MRTREAILPDAEQIQQLISGHFESGTLLPRSFAEICENVRDFIVAEEHGQIVGRLVYERMIARPETLYGQGIGSNYQAQGLKLSKHFKV